MARKSKIPLKLHSEIKKMNSDGLTSTKIKVWLKETHNISAGLTAIQTLLRQATQEYKAAYQTAFAKAVADSAAQDIEIIHDKIVKLNLKMDAAIQSDDLSAVRVYGDLLSKFQDRRMKLSGLDKDGGSLDDQMLDDLMAKLGR